MRISVIKAVYQYLGSKIICDKSCYTFAFFCAECFQKISFAYFRSCNKVLCKYGLAA